MTDLTSATAPPATGTAHWPADAIFDALADPVRRRILGMLANGQACTAAELAQVVGRRLDATLKHLAALRRAGLLDTAPDPGDARRWRYALKPEVPVHATEAGHELDFGCCLVRL